MAAVAGLVDITIIQRNQLGEAQTTGGKKFKQGLISIGQDLGLIRCIRGGAGQGASIQQLLSLLYREGAGQGLWGLGRPYAFAWIGVRAVLLMKPLKKTSPGRQPARQAAWLFAGCMQYGASFKNKV